MDVVVVGAGLLGLATAYALQGQREVLVLERETVGHARGGSHGPSRIFRLGYPDPIYVQLARRAQAGWRALEAATGVALLTTTGQLSFGPGAGEVLGALTAAGAAVESLDEDSVADRFPMFAGHGPAVFEPESGVLAADAALHALRTAAACELREHVRVRRVRRPRGRRADRDERGPGRGARGGRDGRPVDARAGANRADRSPRWNTLPMYDPGASRCGRRCSSIITSPRSTAYRPRAPTSTRSRCTTQVASWMPTRPISNRIRVRWTRSWPRPDRGFRTSNRRAR